MGQDAYSPSGSCTPGPNAVSAVGYTNSSSLDSSQSNIVSAIPPAEVGNYTGSGGTPSVSYVGGLVPANLQSVSGLNSLAQTLSQSADLVLTGPITQTDSNNHMPSAMSNTNPVTVVVNGDLTFNGWHSPGYGILLVTGQFTFDPDTVWNGIVLVIGKGTLSSHQNGSGKLIGAVFVATTVDSADNPLPTSAALGSPFFNFTSSSGGDGVYYSSCWIKAVQKPITYKVLSFRER
jgi:hypothetical protein